MFYQVSPIELNTFRNRNIRREKTKELSEVVKKIRSILDFHRHVDPRSLDFWNITAGMTLDVRLDGNDDLIEVSTNKREE